MCTTDPRYGTKGKKGKGKGKVNKMPKAKGKKGKRKGKQDAIIARAEDGWPNSDLSKDTSV